MANVKFSELPAATPPFALTDIAAVVQGGVSKKVGIYDLGDVAGTVATGTISSGTLNLSAVTAAAVKVTLNANITTLTLPSGLAGARKNLLIEFTQDGTGGRTVAWSGVTWDGAAPTIAAAAGAKSWVHLSNLDNGGWVGFTDDNSGGMSNPMTTAGDIITGGASGAPSRLGIGSTGQVLTVVAGAPAGKPPPPANATQTVSSSAGVLDLSATTATVILVTLTENITTITLPAGAASTSIERRIKFTQGGAGTYTVAGWPGTLVVEGGGSAPVALTGVGSVTEYFVANDNNTVYRMYIDASGPGYGQTWQDMTGSRAAGTSYTNSTGKPIMVAVIATGSNSSSVASIFVNGTVIGAQGMVAGGGVNNTVYVIVPPGASYIVAVSGGSIASWQELR